MDAFEQEIIGLLPRLRRLARAITRDYSDADDLVQIAVERAIERADQWQPGTRLDSWIFRILKNAWIDETRARSRRGRVFAPEEEGEFVAGDDAATLEARIEARQIGEAMSRLPEEQRFAVALVLVEGLSYKEAAALLEIPMGTLTSRLVRGRTALMAHLGGGEEE